MLKTYDGNEEAFLSLTKTQVGKVTFGDNNQGNILGKGNIGKLGSVVIEDVWLVENLKHNLLSISQLCDKDYIVKFDKDKCSICDLNGNVLLIGIRHQNVYVIDFDDLSNHKCLSAMHDVVNLWHKKLGHLNFKAMHKLAKYELVKGLPKSKFEKNTICASCQKGKQHRSSFKSKNEISTKRPLELIHIDLFGPIDVSSLGGKKYVLVIVDDFSRFTWTIFLAHKHETFDMLLRFAKRVQNELQVKISTIRSDHGGEFENHKFDDFCNENGILHQFSTPRTPQQNGVVERKI